MQYVRISQELNVSRSKDHEQTAGRGNVMEAGGWQRIGHGKNIIRVSSRGGFISLLLFPSSRKRGFLGLGGFTLWWSKKIKSSYSARSKKCRTRLSLYIPSLPLLFQGKITCHEITPPPH